jgi:hypothetical protein
LTLTGLLMEGLGRAAGNPNATIVHPFDQMPIPCTSFWTSM